MRTEGQKLRDHLRQVTSEEFVKAEFVWHVPSGAAAGRSALCGWLLHEIVGVQRSITFPAPACGRCLALWTAQKSGVR